MLCRYFLASSCIHEHLRLFDCLTEIWIGDRGVNDQVHWPTKEPLERFPQAEVHVGVAAGWQWLERNQEIKVAVGWSVAVRGGRAEQLQSPYAVATTQFFNGGLI